MGQAGGYSQAWLTQCLPRTCGVLEGRDPGRRCLHAAASCWLVGVAWVEEASHHMLRETHSHFSENHWGRGGFRTLRLLHAKCILSI